MERRHIIATVGPTQAKAAAAIGVKQHALSAWLRRAPREGSMAEFIEAVIGRIDRRAVDRAIAAEVAARRSRRCTK